MPLARTIVDSNRHGVPTPSERFKLMVQEDMQGEARWPVSSGGPARETEKEMGWPPCVYFYAGQVIPKGGKKNVVLLYHPDLDRVRPGWATPCDSGGVYKGKSHPFRGADTDPGQRRRATTFLQATNHDIAQWREHFACFLDHFFDGDWQRYLQQDPPTAHAPTTANPVIAQADLPARHPDNWNGGYADWPSWAWEIRIEASVPVAQNLDICFIRPGLKSWLLENDPRSNPGGDGAHFYRKSLVQRTEEADNPVKEAREWMIEEIGGKIAPHGTP